MRQVGDRQRRHFLKVSALTAACLATSRLPVAGGQPARATPVIDGLGEIRIDYEPALLDAMLESGLRACVITVGNPALHGPTAFDDVVAEIQVYDRYIAAHPDRLSRAQSVADIDRAAARRTIALIYYPQNAAALQDDIGRLERLRDLGVRIIQLTYNTRNLIGDGCLERTNAGLSRFGVDVGGRMTNCGSSSRLPSARPRRWTRSGCRKRGRCHARGLPVVFDIPETNRHRAAGPGGSGRGVGSSRSIVSRPNARNTLDE